MTKVLYVYHGTAGLAGAYIHGIAQSMNRVADVECHLAVNFYYRFAESGCKITRPFFRFSEATSENRFLRLPMIRYFRLPIRWLEMILAYLCVLLYVVRADIDVVNLSVTDNRFVTVLFAACARALGRRLYVTAHDSIPYGIHRSFTRRRRLYEMADKVIVHYDHVKEDLLKQFGIAASKVFLHPYPWSHVAAIVNEKEYTEHMQTIREMVGGFSRVFLFIGVLRPEKGLSNLIDAWKHAEAEIDDRCLLLVAGKPVAGEDKVVPDLPTAKLISRYLSSEEFWALLNIADVVVMPYAVDYYAHSSVALMAYLASKCIVASDIPLFEQLIDDDSGYKFKANDVGDLARVLIHVAKEDPKKLRRKGKVGRQRVIAEWAELPRALAKLYSSTGS